MLKPVARVVVVVAVVVVAVVMRGEHSVGWLLGKCESAPTATIICVNTLDLAHRQYAPI